MPTDVSSHRVRTCTEGSKVFHNLCLTSSKIRKDDVALSYECHAIMSGNDALAEQPLAALQQFYKTVWVSRGNHFSLDFHFSFGEPALESGSEFLLQRLAGAFSRTKLWSGLHLIAAVVRTGPSSLSVCLSYDETSIGCSKGQSKIALSYTSRLTPPKGTLSSELHRVIIDIILDRRWSSTFDGLSPCTRAKRFHDEAYPSSKKFHHEDILEDFGQDVVPQHQARFVHDDNFVPIEDIDNNTRVESAILSTQFLHSTQSQISDAYFVDISDDANEGVSQTGSTAFLDTAFHLVSNILKHDLLGIPKQSRVKPVKVESIIRLPTLCPAMFVPGYLKAMNERSIVLSSINSSLTRIARRARSSDLSNRATGTISQQLWNLAQCGVFNSKASSTLSNLDDILSDSSSERPKTRKEKLEMSRKVLDAYLLDDDDDNNDEGFQDVEILMEEDWHYSNSHQWRDDELGFEDLQDSFEYEHQRHNVEMDLDGMEMLDQL